MVDIDGYFIDAALNETHTYESDVTDYPVESGSNITDNVHNKSPVVSIHGLVSDTPIGPMVNVRAQQGPNNSTGEFDFLPSDEALAKLLAIRDAREPISIGTTLKRYDNMVMLSLEIPIDAATGYALEFTATFKQIIFFNNNRTTVRVAEPRLGVKTKHAAPPVVLIHNGPKHITTVNGRDATWNPKKGRYEYGLTGDGHGNAVPDSDLWEGEQDDPAAGVGRNETYFDPSTDEWKNSDGTAVTQSQLDSKKGGTQYGGQHWWDGAKPDWTDVEETPLGLPAAGLGLITGH